MIFNSINNWLSENYGSRRGALSTFRFRVDYFLGKYKNYSEVDWESVDRLIFVCKGNICRSAYSEAFAKSLGIEAISCGLDTEHGNPANESAAKVGLQRDMSLEQHKTTPVESIRFQKTDLVLAMEPWQAEHISNNYSGYGNCSLLGLWGKPIKPYIHDPYGASLKYFNNCFDFLEDAINEIARKIS